MFLPEEFHGQRSLPAHSSWGCKELDTAEPQTLLLCIFIVKIQQIFIGWNYSSCSREPFPQLATCLQQPQNDAINTCHFSSTNIGSDTLLLQVCMASLSDSHRCLHISFPPSISTPLSHPQVSFQNPWSPKTRCHLACRRPQASWPSPLLPRRG